MVRDTQGRVGACGLGTKSDRSDLSLSFDQWIDLMDGPPGNTVEWGASDESKRKARCPKMAGEWTLSQESLISGDERTLPDFVLTFKAKLSIPQCRWNFLRSQTIEQVEGGDVDAEK